MHTHIHNITNSHTTQYHTHKHNTQYHTHKHNTQYHTHTQYTHTNHTRNITHAHTHTHTQALALFCRRTHWVHEQCSCAECRSPDTAVQPSMAMGSPECTGIQKCTPPPIRAAGQREHHDNSTDTPAVYIIHLICRFRVVHAPHHSGLNPLSLHRNAP